MAWDTIVAPDVYVTVSPDNTGHKQVTFDPLATVTIDGMPLRDHMDHFSDLYTWGTSCGAFEPQIDGTVIFLDDLCCGQITGMLALNTVGDSGSTQTPINVHVTVNCAHEGLDTSGVPVPTGPADAASLNLLDTVTVNGYSLRKWQDEGKLLSLSATVDGCGSVSTGEDGELLYTTAEDYAEGECCDTTIDIAIDLQQGGE